MNLMRTRAKVKCLPLVFVLFLPVCASDSTLRITSGTMVEGDLLLTFRSPRYEASNIVRCGGTDSDRLRCDYFRVIEEANSVSGTDSTVAVKSICFFACALTYIYDDAESLLDGTLSLTRRTCVVGLFCVDAVHLKCSLTAAEGARCSRVAPPFVSIDLRGAPRAANLIRGGPAD